MRIRTIKPEFFTSEQIVECSTSARLLFVGLWVFSDDGGVHPASVKRLKMEVFPGDSFTDSDVQKLIDQLIDASLLIEFESEGQAYWHVPTWDKHQRIDRPTLRYPRPDAPTSTIIRRALDESSASHRDGMESNGMEGNGEKKKEARRVAPHPPTLDEIKAYCRERRNSVNPEQFFDHYQANGWVQSGGQKIRDWKAAVRTWERNSFPKNGSGKNGQQDPMSGLLEYAASGNGACK